MSALSRILVKFFINTKYNKPGVQVTEEYKIVVGSSNLLYRADCKIPATVQVVRETELLHEFYIKNSGI